MKDLSKKRTLLMCRRTKISNRVCCKKRSSFSFSFRSCGFGIGGVGGGGGVSAALGNTVPSVRSSSTCTCENGGGGDDGRS